MDLEPYVEDIRRQLVVVAESGGDDAALAERLMAPLEASIRLALQDALAAAAEEITLDLAPGSVELRLRGRVPEFVVTVPPSDPSEEELPTGEGLVALGTGSAATDGEEATVSRINLRLPDRLKSRIEEAAASEGLSVNVWVVRAVAAVLERTDPAHRRASPRGAQRYTGWAR
jgi:hypothetical protein